MEYKDIWKEKPKITSTEEKQMNKRRLYKDLDKDCSDEFDDLVSKSRFSYNEIISKRRFVPLADERQRIVKILVGDKDNPKYSLSTIGRVMHRDHSSISHLLNKRGNNE